MIRSKPNGIWVLIVLMLLTTSACSSGVNESGRVEGTMPKEWEPQLSSRLAFNWSLSIVQYRGDFWATTWAHDFLGPGLLLRFRSATKTAKQYTVQLEEGRGIPSVLLVTAKGELWGGGMNPLDPESIRREGCDPGFENHRAKKPLPWVLSRYDSSEDRFKPIQDKAGIVRGCQIRTLTEDKKGDLWLIVDDGSYSPLLNPSPNPSWEEWLEEIRIALRPRLLRFNPRTGEAVFIDLNAVLDTLSLQRVNDVLSAPDDSMWIEAGGVAPAQDKVLRYEPETGTVQDLGAPSQQYDDLTRLYLDHQGRLWTSHVAWADAMQDPTLSWHALDSTIFYIPGGIWQGDDFKPFTFQIHQSPDGLMWFLSGAGLITYNLEKDKWMRVASSNSTIVQDENGEIWTAAYGQFYRYRPPQ